MEHQNIPTTAAAKYLGVSASYLNKMRGTGGGPMFFKLGKRVLYSITDLDSWLVQRRRATTSSVS